MQKYAKVTATLAQWSENNTVRAQSQTGRLAVMDRCFNGDVLLWTEKVHLDLTAATQNLQVCFNAPHQCLLETSLVDRRLAASSHASHFTPATQPIFTHHPPKSRQV